MNRACRSDRVGYLPEERGLYKHNEGARRAALLCRIEGLRTEASDRRLAGRHEFYAWRTTHRGRVKGMSQKVSSSRDRSRSCAARERSAGSNINAECREVIVALKKDARRYFSTHDMASPERMCDFS